MREDWEVVIGLEIHVQLSTESKIFSGASTKFGASPNTQACAVDLGLPGVLPVVNEAVYPKAIAFGLGVGATIGERSCFDRKNYFYPDLPKGYQITQMDEPIVIGGQVEISLADGSTKTVRITRAHLEEDAGKSLHEDFHGMTGIDLNRAGTPLLEIVSEPEMSSATEAVSYAKTIHQLVTYLSVSDGNMSEGSLRCDANVSIRKKGDDKLGVRTETKNVNSFRFLKKAIEFEIERQIDILESGGRIAQETRLYDPDRDETRPMRSKETATDYRYFPEPDLLPVVINEAYINDIRKQMPELPAQKRVRFEEELGLTAEDANLIASDLGLATYFEICATTCSDPGMASNWVKGELLASVNRDDLLVANAPVTPIQLGTIILRIKDETISGKIAKTIFNALWQGEADSVDGYIEANGLKQVSDSSALEPIVDQIIQENPKQVEQYRAGKTKVLGFFVGQVMKQTGGKANPKQVNELVISRLS
ncbi:MAG: Asp-tRNA(Asn)/Glu-tRNA(Gln) amidotransferase subunit GatB [Gammaproteobacteria bacterium]|jgi:aspartyl-tRNA(Asn)/glutamyl-tRNA(Gln) amidotransferase subunit B|nr:Asp-tRNA(Asn)/Glu-tRNA(Gln) amidotransferase subunit GatB [Gammaproteobacteria bacterium]MBT4491684.1 Asp-tRNA(Asn)/Glu-tRNA(Gln) amidotransferase subunit GatB [Gammaproteobacteria bacterium]MBT7371360.1 Asp-tRNA(Asn)/Glu-tRNA(Gln) amidotransferase subunit GatB [Gammaproteobacteria bacterium]